MERRMSRDYSTKRGEIQRNEEKFRKSKTKQ
jgi:hypothetical protein